MKSIGSILKNSRDLMQLTLRQVEEATGISNAYLSQLENDKIKKPSANVLYKLSNIYGINMNDLLATVGIIEKQTSEKHKLLNTVAFSTETLTEEEEEELLKYLKFLRQK